MSERRARGATRPIAPPQDLVRYATPAEVGPDREGFFDFYHFNQDEAAT